MIFLQNNLQMVSVRDLCHLIGVFSPGSLESSVHQVASCDSRRKSLTHWIIPGTMTIAGIYLPSGKRLTMENHHF